ncbi:MAG: hypothetical protein PHY56_04130 [Candidatus Omnitrophica bacterium]|nr:hypothetical protein [Candidatus Omnitrophota bacterium]
MDNVVEYVLEMAEKALVCLDKKDFFTAEICINNIKMEIQNKREEKEPIAAGYTPDERDQT